MIYIKAPLILGLSLMKINPQNVNIFPWWHGPFSSVTLTLTLIADPAPINRGRFTGA